MHQNMPVAAFEHPSDWQARSDVLWNMQHTSQPVLVYAAACNPYGTESCEFLPVEACYWAARSASGYTVQDAWADAVLMGRTAYEDPNSQYGNHYYDTGQHAWVWTDGQGNFLPTNDPNLDPNIGSDRSWTLAKKVGE